MAPECCWNLLRQLPKKAGGKEVAQESIAKCAKRKHRKLHYCSSIFFDVSTTSVCISSSLAMYISLFNCSINFLRSFRDSCFARLYYCGCPSYFTVNTALCGYFRNARRNADSTVALALELGCLYSTYDAPLKAHANGQSPHVCITNIEVTALYAHL